MGRDGHHGRPRATVMEQGDRLLLPCWSVLLLVLLLLLLLSVVRVMGARCADARWRLTCYDSFAGVCCSCCSEKARKRGGSAAENAKRSAALRRRRDVPETKEGVRRNRTVDICVECWSLYRWTTDAVVYGRPRWDLYLMMVLRVDADLQPGRGRRSG